MKLFLIAPTIFQVLFVSVALQELCYAIPLQDGPRQRLLDGKDLPAKYRTTAPSYIAPPYTPGHRDPYDSAVDSVGRKLDPLPWRNGLGASVLGPWNRGRAQQSPDLVRPPSTDHGSLPNMRWSFVDSHIRIEVGAGNVPPFCWGDAVVGLMYF